MVGTGTAASGSAIGNACRCRPRWMAMSAVAARRGPPRVQLRTAAIGNRRSAAIGTGRGAATPRSAASEAPRRQDRRHAQSRTARTGNKRWRNRQQAPPRSDTSAAAIGSACCRGSRAAWCPAEAPVRRSAERGSVRDGRQAGGVAGRPWELEIAVPGMKGRLERPGGQECPGVQRGPGFRAWPLPVQ